MNPPSFQQKVHECFKSALRSSQIYQIFNLRSTDDENSIEWIVYLSSSDSTRVKPDICPEGFRRLQECFKESLEPKQSLDPEHPEQSLDPEQAFDPEHSSDDVESAHARKAQKSTDIRACEIILYGLAVLKRGIFKDSK